MSHAHIDEMCDAGAFRHADRLDSRALIDLYEFLSFRGTGVRYTHQLDEFVASRKMLFVGSGAERVS
jgi:hypothetical protein